MSSIGYFIRKAAITQYVVVIILFTPQKVSSAQSSGSTWQ